MSEVAVIGPEALVAGFALAGAHVYPATTADEARAAWRVLPHSVGVVILAEGAAAAIDEDHDAETRAGTTRLRVVLPT